MSAQTRPKDDAQRLLQTLADQINALGLDDRAKKQFLGELVAATWPKLPDFSTLTAPVIEEVQKATLGTGVVMTFNDRGTRKAVVVKVGGHYQGPRYAADPACPHLHDSRRLRQSLADAGHHRRHRQPGQSGRPAHRRHARSGGGSRQ